MQDMETLLKRMTGALEALEKADDTGTSTGDLKMLVERNQLLEDTLTDTISAVSDYIQSVNDILQMNQSSPKDSGDTGENTEADIFASHKRAVGE